jgi:SAM-dependent methyltransferase
MKHWARGLLGWLERHYHATRLVSWPEGESLRIAVLTTGRDRDHLERCLDALETFHPGSAVTLVGPLAALGGAEAELREQYPELATLLAVPPGNVGSALRPDLALLLHPWPDAAAQDAPEQARLGEIFKRMPAGRKWILFKNQELWDGRTKARALRRVLNTVRPGLLARIEQEDAEVLRQRVEPHLERARQWAGERPCAHERAAAVFKRPRYEMFCPDCGTGFTPPEHAPAQESLMRLYGAGYALSSRYMGRRGLMAYAEGCIGHVRGYLESLGFDAESLEPERRSVLDYGCGNGRYSLLWRRLGWRYVGIDPSQDNVGFARRYFGEEDEAGEEARKKTEFVTGGLDGDALRERGPFGMIFLSHVLEHVPEPLALLSELRKLAAPGGWLYVEVPNALRYTWSPQHRGYLSAEHLWDFAPGYLAAVAREAGWLDARVREVENPDCPYLVLLARQEGAKADVNAGAETGANANVEAQEDGAGTEPEQEVAEAEEKVKAEKERAEAADGDVRAPRV